MTKNFEEKILQRAILIREFEKIAFIKSQEKKIKFPIYLGFGQEYIASSLSTYILDKKKISKPHIFIQHRGHAAYLAFGGSIEKLVKELLGRKDGCSFGMGGSASIQSLEKNIYGHDGLMGSNGPISVGACFANNKPTICFLGDAAAEEDYCLAAYGWASTKKLPILFVIEDNNLSILTEKKVRRNWEIHDVAKSMGIEAFNTDDDPSKIFSCLKNVFKKPMLLNINTNRYFWHAGAGIDNTNLKTFHDQFTKKFSNDLILNYEKKYSKKIMNLWKLYE